MPASVLHDMPSQCFSGQNGSDINAFNQVAMEMSILGLTDTSDSSNGIHSPTASPPFVSDNHLDLQPGSSNTTECVPVPSSEHVAEIVGRQGNN